MNSKKDAPINAQRTQEICIDLPGESVKCWRSGDHVKVILRKHRDVFFDINIKPGATYTIESTSDYYDAREKKLRRISQFQDGEQFHLWIGRNYKGVLLLKSQGEIIGTYEPNRLDSTSYDSKPAIKPEPLMIILGKREFPTSFMCSPHDPYDISLVQNAVKPMFDIKLPLLKEYGTVFEYKYMKQKPEIAEYVAVAEALPAEIQPQVLKQLDSGQAVVGTVTQIFMPPQSGVNGSGLYRAIFEGIAWVADKEFLKANSSKEILGYIQENWRMLDKALMTVRVEKRVIGKYRVIFKGKPLGRSAAQLFGAAEARAMTRSSALGSHTSSFIDGGFGRTGSAGYGGVKRLLLTTAENFRSGMKIQVIGTIIDIVCDANDVYVSENGSRELSEFLGRAGVSVIKAGVTAAIGSAIAMLITMALGTLFVSGAPVLFVAALVVAGFIFAAHMVDRVDDRFNIKDSVAGWAR